MHVVDTSIQKAACARAALELGIADDAPLNEEELSVALKYALCQADASDNPQRALDQLDALWDWSTTGVESGAQQALSQCGQFRQRLIELAQDVRTSQRLAPELCLAPRPLSEQRLCSLLSGPHNHAVVFAAPALFTHELYPLVVDAFSADSAAIGRAHFNVLGVHVDWIDEAHCARRVILFDLQQMRFVEAPLATPIPIHSAHFLSLGRDEQALHAHWSTRLPVAQINPWAPAQLADDKLATIRAWDALGLPTPATRAIGSNDERTVDEWINRHGQLVVKPNRASEGRGVAFVRTARDWEAYVSDPDRADELILQVRRDRVFWRDDAQGTLHSLALRVHVATHRSQPRADAHYVQLGAHADVPASRGRGGRIVPITALRERLVYACDSTWQPLALDDAFWRLTFDLAERAASAFDGLRLVGLDLVIDLDDGRPTPVLIEANPRPAGLCQARRSHDGNTGISEALWDGLRDVTTPSI